MKLLLTGGTGQLGNSIIKFLPRLIDNKKINIISPKRSEFDLGNISECAKYLSQINPDLIINCAAYTNVEKAEENPKEALLINSKAPELFAQKLNESGGFLIQISTDYIFEGNQKSPYKTDQLKSPLGAYGLSKSIGEDLIIKNFLNKNQYTIIRTSWLISPWGKNFVKTIVKLLTEKDNTNPIRVVDDQIGCVTSTRTLTMLINEIIKFKINCKEIPNILHWSNSGETTWYEISLTIKKLLKDFGYKDFLKEIIPVKTSEYITKAKRPKYSVLDTSITSQTFNIKSSYWEKELRKIVWSIYKKDKFNVN